MSTVAELTLERMPLYLKYLRSLPDDAGVYISSGAIAAAVELGDVLVRKDLAQTDCVGRPKVGYVRTELIAAIEKLLLCDREKGAVIVGAGALGKALLDYSGFGRYGIKIVAAYDSDPAKIGTSIGGKPVYDVSSLGSVAEKLAVICVPASAAQSVADRLIKAGVKGILNFAPVQLKVSDGVKVVNIDVAANVAVMAAELNQKDIF